VDVVLRQKDDRLILHLINQSESRYHAIPWVGPVTIRMKLSEKPSKLYRAFEEGEITWKYANDEGILKVEIPKVHIHAALVVDMR
jgi:hypothetical protein